MSIIETNFERCVGCRDCVGACPSPLANYVKTLDDGRQVIEIDESKCIACGECVRRCTHGGRDYNDDTEKFFKALGDRKMVIIAHPSIKAAFGKKWQAVLRWFKQNGSDGIYDGALGSDICTWSYCKQIDAGTTRKVVSQHCPAIVRYMEIYHPDQIGDVAPIASPMSCEAVYIRDYIKKNYAVAVLSPCPAMKLEFTESGHVEYNVTFKRLKEHFHRQRIEFRDADNDSMLYDFDDQAQGAMGGIYSAPGGLRYNLVINDPGLVAVSSDGVDTVYRDLEEYLSTDRDKRADVFEALSCAGGCGMGIGAFDKDDVSPLEIKSIHRKVEIDARSRRKVSLNGLDKQFKLFEDRLNPRSLARKFENCEKEPPAKEAIDRNLAELEAFLAAHESKAEAPAAAPSPTPAPAADDGQLAAYREMIERMTGSAADAKQTSDTLSAEIAGLREQLGRLDNNNKQSASIASIMENILAKVTDFCSQSTSLDENSLPQVVSILEKLKAAMTSLSTYLGDAEAAGSAIEGSADSLQAGIARLGDVSADMMNMNSGE
ncbi:MAG: 4Fe-4S binding protein [Oscillospiraceae bacterium]|nr:4Fe-4S binding protein [Oscillospiraceae bacterium]